MKETIPETAAPHATIANLRRHLPECLERLPPFIHRATRIPTKKLNSVALDDSAPLEGDQDRGPRRSSGNTAAIGYPSHHHSNTPCDFLAGALEGLSPNEEDPRSRPG